MRIIGCCFRGCHHHGRCPFQRIDRFGDIPVSILGTNGELLLVSYFQLDAEVRGGGIGYETGELAIHHYRTDTAGITCPSFPKDLILTCWYLRHTICRYGG